MEEKQKKVAVFIDGGNFYFKMKSNPLHFENLTKFNFYGLISWLARDRQVIWSGYYIGLVRAANDNIKGQEMRKNQQKLFAHLKSKSQNITIKTGYLMKNAGTYHEKGVDVQMAVDILVGAYENTYDTAIIISSDTDLIPALDKIRSLGKHVEYIGFAHQPSIALQRHVNLSRLLIKEELIKFAEQVN